MSQNPHRIVQNDVGLSVLPELVCATGQGIGTGRAKSKRPAMPGVRDLGFLETALPLDALANGLYRTRGEAECPNDVRILNNGRSFFITEAEYRRRECQPFFEDLPWRGIPDEEPAGGKG